MDGAAPEHHKDDEYHEALQTIKDVHYFPESNSSTFKTGFDSSKRISDLVFNAKELIGLHFDYKSQNKHRRSFV